MVDYAGTRQDSGSQDGTQSMKDDRRGNPERPLIAAEELVFSSGVGLGQRRLRSALLSCMPVGEMKDRFCQKDALEFPLSRYWDSWVREDGVVLVGPVFGGPMCSVILEELFALGVRSVVGYGYSGCLDSEVAPASIMVAESSFCSDGTSKEYCTDDEVSADAGMLDRLQGLIRKRGIEPVAGKVWTTDALYREFPSKVAHWREKGARFVNLETASLYAVSREKGFGAVYLSVVSDSLVDGKWSGWHEDRQQSRERMWDICLDMVEAP